jgi:hypothetical protein
MQFALSVNWAYNQLVGEQGTTSGQYAAMTYQADLTIDALFDTAKVSKGADLASEEAAARREGQGHA